MPKRMAVVLAAGKGTRMKSNKHKVLHELNGFSMVEHVVRALRQTNVDRIVTVVGYQAEEVKNVLEGTSEYAYQEEQLGTGHAVQQAESMIGAEMGHTLVVSGDTPLLTAETLDSVFDLHEKTQAKATVLTAFAQNPTGYGRVIRQADNSVSHIVEQKDANDQEQAVQEINTGTYIFDNQALFEALKFVDNQNAQGEYYLPDVIKILRKQDQIISAYMMDDMNEAIGVNDRIALSHASSILSQRINEAHMRNGITLMNSQSTYIEADVVIGPDTIIEGNVSIKGQTIIGAGCVITSGTEIVDSEIGDFVQIRQSVIESSKIGKNSNIGPFSHLRPSAELKENVHIGNFVEVKKSTLGEGTKAGHLSYIGDAELGDNINVGCGTIFVNYDGKYKHKSTIGDNSFIGSGVSIVSPVNVGKNVVLAAGSTITKDVTEGSLAIARARQQNKENYWLKFINK